MEPFLEELQPEKTYLVSTTELKLIVHWLQGQFYLRKLASKDPRYCRITGLSGKERYEQHDLDLGAEIEYIHPRLHRSVNAGKITSIIIR